MHCLFKWCAIDRFDIATSTGSDRWLLSGTESECEADSSGSRAGPRPSDCVALNLPVAADRHRADGLPHGVWSAAVRGRQLRGGSIPSPRSRRGQRSRRSSREWRCCRSRRRKKPAREPVRRRTGRAAPAVRCTHAAGPPVSAC